MKLVFAIWTILMSLLMRTAFSSNIWPSDAECGKLNDDHFYKQTNVTELNEYPWTGLVAYKVKGEIVYKCMAVLISRRYLLSPAHCYEREEFLVDHVLLGEWNPTNSIVEQDCDANDKCAPLPKKYEISEVVVNPDFSKRSIENDVALIRLKVVVIFNEYIAPICMPPFLISYDYYSGQYLHTTGFTLRRQNETPYKVKALVHVLGVDRCMTALELFKIGVSWKQICGFTNADTPLLSGAPLMAVKAEHGNPQRVFLVGLASAGALTPKSHIPDIFVGINSFRDWINYNVVE